MTATDALLSIEDLHVTYSVPGPRLRRRLLHAVDGVSLSIRRGETYGLVGESGCGKSTLVRALLGLQPVSGGQVVLDGVDLTTLRGRKLRAVRPRMQVVFQDPYSSLDADLTVHEIVAEPLRVTRRYRRERVEELLALVGLDPSAGSRKPAQFSGGQRQRIGIARALALEPDVLVLDEPVSALDMSVQAQVVNLLRQLQRRLGLTCLFIAHDLSVVRYVSDRVGVMYLGRIVETGACHDVFTNPQHPYTRSLLAAVPIAEPNGREQRRGRTLAGELPDPTDPPSGCAFRTRCPKARARCAAETPPLAPAGAADQQAACWFPGAS